jgi:beta-propeller repeat-containing protein
MRANRPVLELLCLVARLAVANSTQLSSNQVIAHYVDIGDQGQSRLLAADGAGNLFVVSTVVEPWGPGIRVTKTDPAGNVLASLDFAGNNGLGTNVLSGAAADGQGNIVIAGTISSGDFPLVQPLFTTTAPQTAFVIKIDSQLQHILFSTQLGGSKSGPNYAAGTSVGALSLDGSGNIYVAGTTNTLDFPVTANAYQTQPPQPDSSGTPSYGFVSKISADGTKLVFSTYFGASGSVCTNSPMRCTPVSTGVSAMQLDSAGSVVIAGGTNAKLPVTSGAYLTNCGACDNFAAKLTADGSKLSWATYLAPSASANPGVGLSISTMALASDGGVIVGGSVLIGLTVTPGVVQPSIPPQAAAVGADAGFVLQLDPSGERLVFATYLGSNTSLDPQSINNVAFIAVDAQGTIWVTGGSDPSNLPLPSGTPSLGPVYTVGLSPGATAITSAVTAPLGAAGVAIAATGEGTVVTLGRSGSLLIAGSAQGPSLVGVTNSAAHGVSGAVPSLELISFYGVGLGPANPLGAQVVNQGGINVVSASSGGVQVLFDGIAAPLLYVGPTQINAIVPAEVYGRESTGVEIVTPGGNIAGLTFQVRLSQPQVFRYPGTVRCSTQPGWHGELGEQPCRTQLDCQHLGDRRGSVRPRSATGRTDHSVSSGCIADAAASRFRTDCGDDGWGCSPRARLSGSAIRRRRQRNGPGSHTSELSTADKRLVDV